MSFHRIINRASLKEKVKLLERTIQRMKAQAEKHGEAEFARGFTLGEAYAKRVASGQTAETTKLDGE